MLNKPLPSLSALCFKSIKNGNKLTMERFRKWGIKVYNKVLDILNDWWHIINTIFKLDLSLSASCFRSIKRGNESRNSFIFSSKMRPTFMLRTSLGSLRRPLRNPSIPSCSTCMLRFDHRVSDHCSRAPYKKDKIFKSQIYSITYHC